jgi:hypothetical protein
MCDGRIEVLAEALPKIHVFWDVMLCRLANRDLSEDHSVTSQT